MRDEIRAIISGDILGDWAIDQIIDLFIKSIEITKNDGTSEDIDREIAELRFRESLIEKWRSK